MNMTRKQIEANARAPYAAEIMRLRAALQWIVDHGDTGGGNRPAFHAMRAHARNALCSLKIT